MNGDLVNGIDKQQSDGESLSTNDVEASKSDVSIAGRSSTTAEAVQGLRRALLVRERVLPAEHKDLALSVANLGHVLVRLERLDEGVQLLERFRAMVASANASPKLRAQARRDLAEALAAQAQPERAREIAREGLDELGDADEPELRRELQARVDGR